MNNTTTTRTIFYGLRAKCAISCRDSCSRRSDVSETICTVSHQCTIKNYCSALTVQRLGPLGPRHILLFHNRRNRCLFVTALAAIVVDTLALLHWRLGPLVVHVHRRLLLRLPNRHQSTKQT